MGESEGDRMSTKHIPRNVNALHKAEQIASGFNTWVAIVITKAVGTMPMAYLFLLLAIIGFPGNSAPLSQYVQWLSQTCLQLVFLPIITVGQNVLNRHAELMADEQYKTTEAIFADAEADRTVLSAIQEEQAAQRQMLEEMRAEIASQRPTARRKKAEV